MRCRRGRGCRVGAVAEIPMVGGDAAAIGINRCGSVKLDGCAGRAVVVGTAEFGDGAAVGIAEDAVGVRIVADPRRADNQFGIHADAHRRAGNGTVSAGISTARA